LGSGHFVTSDRNRRFLEFVVEETLAQRAANLKGYTIGTQVFGRPDDFDPQLDPVVRMEARRVRRALEHFYLVDGDAGAPVRIAMPTGGYVPEFQTPRGSATGAAAPTAQEQPILVVPFDSGGDPS